MSQYLADNDVANVAFFMGLQTGKDTEREAIVAFLKQFGKNSVEYPDTLAERIERKEHLK